MADDEVFKLGDDSNVRAFEPAAFLTGRVFGVAIDGSACSKEALYEALTLLHPKRDKLVLISMYHKGSQLEEKHAGSYLSQAVGLVKDWEGRGDEQVTSIDKCFTESTDPRKGILSACKEMGVDLLFVGSHGHGLGGTFTNFKTLGSVAHFLVNHAPIPVVVCRKGTVTGQ